MCGPTADTVGREAEPPGGARNTTRVAPTADRVAVLEPAAADQPLAVDPRAVVGEAVVHQRPRVADPLERGVYPRDPCVPLERDVVGGAAANRHPVRGVARSNII